MVQLKPPSKSAVIYPDSDGQPMADNTKQFRWIVVIEQNLELIFADDPDVFVAGDLLWYPVEGNNKKRVAPDVMVALGRPKGDRGSSRQWLEDDVAPLVVFEILSPGNTHPEMTQKCLFYDHFGVEEYYLYDPDDNELSGWLRQDGRLEKIELIADWVSPQLKIRFVLSDENLSLFRPDGEPFLTDVEIAQKAEEERQRAEEERQRAEAAEAKASRLAEKLRELGVDPEQV